MIQLSRVVFSHAGTESIPVHAVKQNIELLMNGLIMASPPGNLDVLLMEGTNLGSDKRCITEHELESEFVALFRATAGRVFVAWSAQNVDRTVTLYRACLKTGRTLVVDLYTAEVMEALAGFGKLPRPGWNNLKVVITSAFARLYRNTGQEDFVERMVKKRNIRP
jgi:ribonuclease J